MQQNKKLQETLDKINKTYGEGTVSKLSDKPSASVEFISSGSLTLDIALGGGFPLGRIVELHGWESSGKTTIAIHTIAESQKKGRLCAFVDAEHAFDPQYAKAVGVDLDALYFVQPDNGEQALEITELLIASGEFEVVVVDSVASLVPKAEIDGSMGDSKMGLHARLMSQAMRKLTPIVSKNKTLCIFINQIREKIGVMFGNPETTTGGNALKFYASIRVHISKSTLVKEGEDNAGNLVKCKVVKNKVAPPHQTAEFDIMWGEGISRLKEVIDLGISLGIIKKAGSWFSYKDTKIGQGLPLLKEVLKDNPDIVDEVEKQIRKAYLEGVQLDDTPYEGGED